jgi:geranylgeranyl reductase
MQTKMQTSTSRQAARCSRVTPFAGVRSTRVQQARLASSAFSGAGVQRVLGVNGPRSVSRAVAKCFAIADGAKLPEGRKLRVAVIGGGPSGACAAETLAEGGVETFLIERKLDNCKVGRNGRI